MLMLEANFQIQKFQIDVTAISATTKKKQKIGPILHSPPGTRILQVSLSSSTFLKNNLYSPYFLLGPFYLPWFLPPSPKSHCSAKGHNELTSNSSGNSPVPVSPTRSVASDARVPSSLWHSSARRVWHRPPLCARASQLLPLGLQSWCWLRTPSSAHCSSHFTCSDTGLPSTSSRWLPSQSWPRPLPQDSVHRGTCPPFRGEAAPHAVPTETRGAHTPLGPGHSQQPSHPTADSTRTSAHERAADPHHSK